MSLMLLAHYVFIAIVYSSSSGIAIMPQWKIFTIFVFASKHQAFIKWVAKVIFRMGQLMIRHQKWSNMAKKAKKNITFDAKSSIVPCEKSLSRLIKWTLDVSKASHKNCDWKKSTVHSYRERERELYMGEHGISGVAIRGSTTLSPVLYPAAC